MATQIIDSAVDAPVTSDDFFILADTGSISSNENGTALTLSSGFDAFIDGGVYAINEMAISTDSPSSTASLVIGENGSIVATGQITSNPVLTIVAVNITDAMGPVQNRGVIDGEQAGIQFYSQENLTFDSTVDNMGKIYGDVAIVTSNIGSHLTVNNDSGALIDGNTNSIVAGGELDLNNDGTIIGDILLSASPFSPTSNNEAPVAKIVNKGAIVATSDIAISLGDGADKVKNKGVVYGEIHLGGGKDAYRGGDSKETVFGGGGKDDIKAKAGKDTISGGQGRDTIKPGGGKDLIIHAVGDGKDKIFGFKPGKDILDISDHGFSGFKDLKSALTEKKDKLVIDLTGNDEVVLKDVALSDLSAEDFVL